MIAITTSNGCKESNSHDSSTKSYSNAPNETGVVMIDILAPEKVRFGSYLWRDRVLIVLNLLVVLGSFLLSWASRNYYAPSKLSSSLAWLLSILYLHVLWAAIVLPLAHIGMEFKHPNQAASKLLYLFQHPRTLTLLLFEFAVTQIILLTTGSSLKEPSPAFLFAYIIFFLVFMWHVYGRDKIDFASLVLTNAWMLMLSDTRSLIADHGFKDFYPLVVSNMMWLALWFGFACLLTLPYLALFPKARQRLKKLDSRLTRFQSYLLLSIAAACFVPYASIGGPATSFFYWIGVIIAAPMLGLLLTKDKLHLAPQSWTLSARTYKLCLAAILGVYLILAFITARSTLWQSNPDMYAYFQIARGYAQGMLPIRGY